MAKKQALGKGLSAILQGSEDNERESYSAGSTPMNGIAEIPVEQIEANPKQPRSHFEEEALSELADSIGVHGVIQPITVRRIGTGKFQIISGERRFRASKKAGVTHIPAYIRDVDDETMLELALVENIQREDLDAIEIAISYQRLLEECNLTQEELSSRVAKKRSTVANYLRLLQLPAEIQIALRDKELSMGHARALAGIDDPKKQLKIFKTVTEKGLSVRKTEELARNAVNGTSSKPAPKTPQLTYEQKKVKEDLERYLDTGIQIAKNNKGGGKLVINYNSEADLKRIIDLLDF